MSNSFFDFPPVFSKTAAGSNFIVQRRLFFLLRDLKPQDPQLEPLADPLIPGGMINILGPAQVPTVPQNARKGPQFLIRHEHRRQIPYHNLLGFAPDRCAVPEASLLPLGLQGVQQAVRQSRKPGLPRFPHRRQIVRREAIAVFPERGLISKAGKALQPFAVVRQRRQQPFRHSSRWRDRPCGRRRTDTPSIPGAAARSPRR